MDTDKRVSGRPSEYRPEYCDLVIDTMAAGKSLAAVSAKLRVARQTLYNWAREYPDFAEAIAIGKDLALAYWEDLAEETAAGEKNGNAAVLNFQMKNRFRMDYMDSQNLTLQGGDDPLKIDNKHTIEFILPEANDEH